MNEPYTEQVLWKMMHEDTVGIVSRFVRQDAFLVWNCDFVKFCRYTAVCHFFPYIISLGTGMHIV